MSAQRSGPSTPPRPGSRQRRPGWRRPGRLAGHHPGERRVFEAPARMAIYVVGGLALGEGRPDRCRLPSASTKANSGRGIQIEHRDYRCDRFERHGLSQLGLLKRRGTHLARVRICDRLWPRPDAWR